MKKQVSVCRWLCCRACSLGVFGDRTGAYFKVGMRIVVSDVLSLHGG